MLEFPPDSPLVSYSRFPQIRRGVRWPGIKVRGIAIHAAITPETNTMAERVVDYFATSSGKANTHYSGDNDSTAQSVPERETCYGAGGANNDFIHIEHAGLASQTPSQWLDAYGFAMLERSAMLSAEICNRYNIRPVHMSISDFKSGNTGIVTHADVVEYTKLGDHWDPGPGFPLTWYISRVAHYLSLEGANTMDDISFGGRTHLDFPHVDSDSHIVLTNPLVADKDHNLHILNLNTGATVTYRFGQAGDHPFSVSIKDNKARFRVVRQAGGVNRMHNTSFVRLFDLP